METNGIGIFLERWIKDEKRFNREQNKRFKELDKEIKKIINKGVGE